MSAHEAIDARERRVLRTTRRQLCINGFLDAYAVAVAMGFHAPLPNHMFSERDGVITDVWLNVPMEEAG